LQAFNIFLTKSRLDVSRTKSLLSKPPFSNNGKPNP
jgi:hypothetical protein